MPTSKAGLQFENFPSRVTLFIGEGNEREIRPVKRSVRERGRSERLQSSEGIPIDVFCMAVFREEGQESGSSFESRGEGKRCTERL